MDNELDMDYVVTEFHIIKLRRKVYLVMEGEPEDWDKAREYGVPNNVDEKSGKLDMGGFVRWAMLHGLQLCAIDKSRNPFTNKLCREINDAMVGTKFAIPPGFANFILRCCLGNNTDYLPLRVRDIIHINEKLKNKSEILAPSKKRKRP